MVRSYQTSEHLESKQCQLHFADEKTAQGKAVSRDAGVCV